MASLQNAGASVSRLGAGILGTEARGRLYVGIAANEWFSTEVRKVARHVPMQSLRLDP
jgi:hypothetical protein